MIEVMLRDLRGRLVLVLLLCVILYFLEPGFHDHGPVDPELASEMGPLMPISEFDPKAPAATVAAPRPRPKPPVVAPEPQTPAQEVEHTAAAVPPQE